MRDKIAIVLVVLICVGSIVLLRSILESPRGSDGPHSKQEGGGQSVSGPEERVGEKSDKEKSAEAIEAALEAKGMGNLKVFRMPSNDPDYYKGKLYETDSIIPDPEYLKGSPRPVVFGEYVHKYLREPLGPKDLAFFEKKLSEAKDDDVRVQCAILLYRYGHAAGETYLASRLGESDRILAATVFALNREEKYLSQILEILSAAPGQSDMTSFQEMEAKQSLVRATSDWEVPGIGEAIFELSKRAPILDIYMASSLAKHDVTEARIPISIVMDRYRDNEAVSHYFAALYLLTGETSFIEKIRDQLSTSIEELRAVNSIDVPTRLSIERCGDAMEALSSLKLPEGTSMLRDSIGELRAVPQIAEPDELRDLLRKALLSLAKSDKGATQETTTVVVSALEDLPDDQNIRLGIAMEMGVEAVTGNPELARTIGESTIELARSLVKLNKVPPYYLPDSSVPILSERNNEY